MYSEKKMPGKKLLLILACIILVIVAALLLVKCGGTQSDAPQPEAQTQPQSAVHETRPAATESGPVEVRLEKPEDVTVEGLKEEYEIGEEITFTAKTSDDYSVISTVKISGDKVEPDKDGYYRATVSGKLYIIIETENVYADAVVTIEESSTHLAYYGKSMTFTLKGEDGTVIKKVTGIVKNNRKITLKKIPVGTWEIEPIHLFGGAVTFSPVTITERESEVTTKRTTGINDSIKTSYVMVDVKSSSVSVRNYKGEKSANIFVQGQKLTGNQWFGMVARMSAEDLNATDYRNIGLNIYKNGSSRIQILSLGNGRAAIKYDNDHVKELSAGLVNALEAGRLLVAVNRTADGKLEVYAGAFVEDMTKLFTVDKTNMGTAMLDQYGLDLMGPLKSADLNNLTSNVAMEYVLPETEVVNQDVTVRFTSSSQSVSYEGAEFTFTLNRDPSVQFTATADAEGKVVLEDIPNGTYQVSAVDLFGGKLTFEDAIVLAGQTELEITHTKRINDTVKSDSVIVDVATSSVIVENLESNKSSNILLQGQDLTGDQWFGMKMQMSAEDLNAKDYRNIGINIYENGSNRIQVVSLGNGRAALKYDNQNVKELSSGLVNALKAGQLLVAVHRTEGGALEVYAGIHSEEMTKLFTVSSPAMGTGDLDQFGLDVQGPLNAAAIRNIVSGNAMAEVLSASDGANQDVTIQLKGKSERMSFAGVELTFTLARDNSVTFTGTADANGKIALSNVPVGTYRVSDAALFGGKLSFEDVIVLEGLTELEITHTQGVNDKVASASAWIEVASSSVFFENSSASTNRSNGYFFLQGQKLTGDQWFGMKVKMSKASLTGNKGAFVSLCIYENGWNLVQVMSAGDGTATVQFNYNYPAVLPEALLNALTGDGMYLAANRAKDGTLTVYGGANAGEMVKLVTVTSSSSVKTNMGTADLDQFGFLTQGKIASASMENIASGTSADAAISGFAITKEDVTFSIQDKSRNSAMSFEGVQFTLTQKNDASVSYTGTVNAGGKLIVKDMLPGTYGVSSVYFFGTELTFSDVTLEIGENEKELTYTQGINDNVNNAAVAVSVKDSGVNVQNLTNGKGYFFLQGQKLTGNAWFGMKLQMSAADLAAADYRNIGLQTYGTGGADYVQVLNNNGNGVLIKYDNSNYYKLSNKMVTALQNGSLYLAVCRTSAGKLEIYAGTAANEMVKLFVVAGPKIKTNAIEQFGVNLNGSIVNAGVQDLAYGATAEAAMPGFALAKENVTVTVKSTSDQLSFAGVRMTFTLNSDAGVTYSGTADANGQIAMNGMLHGTYSVSGVGFFGGQLTFPDITVADGTTAVEIIHKETVTDTITASASNISVNVATSSVYFNNASVGHRDDGKFYFQNGTALTGNVWFGMKVKMSAETLASVGSADRYLGLLIWENPSKPSDGWNMVQVETAATDRGANVNYNNNHHGILTTEYVNALTGDGLYVAVNRKIEGSKTYLKIYVGTSAGNMVYLTETSTDKDKAKPNVGQGAIDEFGIITQGSLKSASIENLTIGTSAEAVLGGFDVAKEDVTVSIKAKSSRMSFAGVSLTFTNKQDTSVFYTATADASGQMAVSGMQHGTYSVSSVSFLGGKLTFPDITVEEGTTAVEITHNEAIQDDITSDASKVSVSVATSSVYISDYTVGDRSKGAFYLKDQTLSGDVWFGMRMKVSAADWTEKDGYPYIAWNSFVGNNWNFVQVMNNNGNGIGAIKYNNNYATGLNADLAAALTGESGLLMLINRTAAGTMDVYLGTGADDMTKMFTVNATASSGKPALNLGNKTLDNFGFLIEGKIGSASIENMVSGTSMAAVLAKF